MTKSFVSCARFTLSYCLLALIGCTVAVKETDDTSKGGAKSKGGQTSVGGTDSGGAADNAGGNDASGGTSAEGGTTNTSEGGTSTTSAAGAGAISGVAGASGATSVPCGTVTNQGQCSGDTLTFCNNAVLTTLDCGMVGGTCAVTNGVADCQAVNRAYSCGYVTEKGTCSSAKMQYCDKTTGYYGTLKTIDCAAYGQTCSPTAASDGGALCVPISKCPTGVTEAGVCTGNTLKFCEDGDLYQFDCGLDECKTIGSFTDCYMPTIASGCGTETAAGRCDGQTRVNCPNNTVQKEECATLGLQCVAATGGATCQRGTTCAAACPTGYSCTSGKCAPTTTPAREWTFAVYLVGNNNLSDAGWDDLNEMEVVGSSNSLAIAVQAKFSQKYSSSVPVQYQVGTYRMLVQKDSDRQTSASMAAATALPTTNMSDPASLTAFVKWAAETYPAKRMAVILWDHGMGYPGGFVDGTGDILTLKEIVSGIKASGVHPDVVGFDACLMGMHEVGMALRGITDWMVGSEEVEPGSGYPYDKVLAHLQTTPTLTPQQFGSAIVDEYAAYFANSTRAAGTTQSLLDLSKISAFNDQLGKIAESINTNLSQQRTAVRSAFDSSSVLRFQVQDQADFRTAMTALGSVSGDIGTTAAAASSALASSGLVARSVPTGTMKNATGLAFYFPKVGFTATELDEYRQATSFLPLHSWWAALNNFRNTSSSTTTPGTGSVDTFSVILSWGSVPDGKTSKADLDLYVYEPNGDFAVPANGTVSQNGVLSGDSYDTDVPRESYELKSSHDSGTYIILAHFYDAPAGEVAYPRLQLFRSDVPGGSRVYMRGKIVNRVFTESPMNATKRVTPPIDNSNFKDVQDLVYTDIWYAFTVDVY